MGKDKCRCTCKNRKKHCVYKKRYTYNSITSACKTDKYLKSIFDDSVIGCGKIIDVVAK